MMGGACECGSLVSLGGFGVVQMSNTTREIQKSKVKCQKYLDLCSIGF